MTRPGSALRAAVRRPGVVVVLALVTSLVGWRVVEAVRSSEPVDLSRHPAPSASSAASCRRLAAALPDSLGGLDRRDVTAAHPGWTAYGDPAVEVRCGVPASTAYRAGDQLISINDVAWFPDESRRGGVDFSLPRSVVNVSVWIPAKYRAELLSLLTDAVKQAQPL